MKRPLATLLCLILAGPVSAEMSARQGWWVALTDKPFDLLIDNLKTAVKANKFGVVTQAGPTGAAKARGIEIPGNRVIGVFNNDYAVRTLELSTAAMIEAPIRFYVTENTDGSATLSYKLPSMVFAPYMAEADGLDVIAAELEEIFLAIATEAVD